MTQSNLATSADYAEALLTVRRAKAVVSVLLFLLLFTELALFFVLRYKPLPAGPSLTQQEQYTRDLTQYFVGLLDFGGLILPALLVAVLYVILNIQLVGRLIGVGRIVGALVWGILLTILLFPWQAVLNNPAINYDETSNAIGMKIPGVVYTWAEVSDPWLGARFGLGENAPGAAPAPVVANDESLKTDLEKKTARAPWHTPQPAELVLHWARYVGFPLLSILILTIIHFKTHRGLRQSLGEDQIIAETTPAA